VLFDSATLSRRVQELARDIARDMPGELLVVVVLKGSFVFAADLIRALDIAGAKPRVDFITLSSYGAGTESKGAVAMLRDISEDVAGQHILLVDDIVDTGRTLKFAKEELLRRGATQVRACLLLDKAARRVVEIKPDYVGFPIEDRFVVGYGLDLAHYYRGLPYIGVVVPDKTVGAE
jgi:hypoxanthine phosphoribosyltransferase